MTNDELIAILVALPEADYRMVVDESEADRRRAFYAAVAAKRRPTLIAMWEADVAQYGEKPYCREYEDGLDGFVIQWPACLVARELPVRARPFTSRRPSAPAPPRAAAP